MGTNNRGSRGSKKEKANKSNKMTFRRFTAKTVQIFTGEAHFLVKSAADSIVATEATIVHKLLPDIPYNHIYADRHNKTEAKQERIINDCKKLKENMNKMFASASKCGNDADSIYNAELNQQ